MYGLGLGKYGYQKSWGFPPEYLGFWSKSCQISGREGYISPRRFLCFLVPNYITTFRVVGTATYDGPEEVWKGAVMWCQTGKGKKFQQNWCSYDSQRNDCMKRFSIK